MNVIGIDPGLKCGWGYYWSEDRPRCGTWDLRGPDKKYGTASLDRLADYLKDLMRRVQPDLVVAEGIVHAYQAASQHSEMRGVIRRACSEFGCMYEAVPPAKLKKYATEKGNATKGQMREAFEKAFPRLGSDLLDDNAIDAMYLADYGLKVFRKQAG